MRVTFFQSGKPQQISPPDPFGYDDDTDAAAAAAGDEPPAWKQFDPLDPDFEQQHHRLLHHQLSSDDPNSDDVDTVDTSSQHLSMTAATAQMPSYDRQMR